ncbi:hypothetical protein BASA81_007362 [Batrachochytrium salamandrivorans]|nr:hypothetical protein BASA81_007362 [Batrachochytrium salamandrivorans]
MSTKKKILMSGSTGLVGSALAKRLKELGYVVLPLTTSQFEGGIMWNPIRSAFSAPIREQLHAVIHLGGAPLKPMWNERMKFDFLESRVNGAKLLAQLILHNPPPETFICTTGVGYYGLPPSDFAGEGFSETSNPFPFQDDANKPFLHEVAAQVEAACDPVREITRVVHPRLAPVLDLNGGALPKLMLPFKVGLGGPLGPGNQNFPWVSLRDVVDAYVFILERKDITGPVNVVSPHASTAKEFATALGEAMHRPCAVPVPAVVLRTVFGKEAAESLVLSSRRILPKVLMDKGFQFRDEDIRPFLHQLLLPKSP